MLMKLDLILINAIQISDGKVLRIFIDLSMCVYSLCYYCFVAQVCVYGTKSIRFEIIFKSCLMSVSPLSA